MHAAHPGKTQTSRRNQTLLQLTLILFSFLLSTQIAQAQVPVNTLDVLSPDKKIRVQVGVYEGKAFYAVAYQGKTLIYPSRLGLEFQSKPDFSEALHISGHRHNQVDQIWTQPWGEEKDIRDHHNELTVSFASAAHSDSKQFQVQFRVFDDGVGFRYRVPAQEGFPVTSDGHQAFTLMDELSEFHFEENLRAWWIPAYKDNRYEYHYSATPMDALDVVHTPITLEGTDVAVSLHEAALVDYASMALRRPNTHGQMLKADLVPWSDGVKVRGSLPMKSPWRTIQIAEKSYQLANSRLILNLNEPNQLGDVSWVQPGTYVGIWWCMHIRECSWTTGEKHGATTENAIRYLDFAAKYGFKGVLIEGWNFGWDGNWIENGHLFNFTQPTADYDIEAISAHARKVGVPVIGHHETGANVSNYEKQLDDAFAYASKHGIRAVKTGYVGNRLDHKEWHHGQHMVQHHNKVIKTAAKHKVAINAHEPIKDTGLRRTYPNMMSREGARGGEYDAWGPATQGNHPEHAAVLPYTRMLAGPMDYTPGVVDLRFGENQGLSSTIARQLALMVVIYSPLQMAADLPRNYVDAAGNEHPAFAFIKQVPADWEESIALAGEIGEFFVIARKDRNSPDWYLAAVTNEDAREIEIPLDFLNAKLKYRAELYQDGKQAHWLHEPHDFSVAQQNVRQGQNITLRMAPGGGVAIRLTPKS